MLGLLGFPWLRSGAIAMVMSLAAATPGRAAAPSELWLSPADDVTQHNPDIHAYFDHPELWSSAAGHMRVFSLPINYLLRSPPDVIHRELDRLRALHLALNVSISGLGVDKKVCGDGVEGMIGRRESRANAEQLGRLGVDVASFSLDLPLSDGHIMTKRQRPNACQLSVHDTAVGTAQSVHALLAVYPNAKIYDSEVPTGIPLAQWTTDLETWLTEYKAASGRDFDGLTMDAWWKFPWEPAVKATSAILARHGIKAGIFIDESGGNNLPAANWLGAAKMHACALRASGIHIDYFAVADWQNMQVRSVPESDPDTLPAMVRLDGGGTSLPTVAARETCRPGRGQGATGWSCCPFASKMRRSRPDFLASSTKPAANARAAAWPRGTATAVRAWKK